VGEELQEFGDQPFHGGIAHQRPLGSTHPLRNKLPAKLIEYCRLTIDKLLKIRQQHCTPLPLTETRGQEHIVEGPQIAAVVAPEGELFSAVGPRFGPDAEEGVGVGGAAAEGAQHGALAAKDLQLFVLDGA
jgi:hypothetical protein